MRDTQKGKTMSFKTQLEQTYKELGTEQFWAKRGLQAFRDAVEEEEVESLEFLRDRLKADKFEGQEKFLKDLGKVLNGFWKSLGIYTESEFTSDIAQEMRGKLVTLGQEIGTEVPTPTRMKGAKHYGQKVASASAVSREPVV
jgi:oligoendopeptidase F